MLRISMINYIFGNKLFCASMKDILTSDSLEAEHELGILV